MLYLGDGAKYQITDRMREADRSRLAHEALAARKGDGGLNGRRIPLTLLAVVTWPFRQLTRLAGGPPGPAERYPSRVLGALDEASVGSGKTCVEVRPAIAI